MKLTDFCIIFGCVLSAMFWFNNARIDVLNNMQTSQMLLNKNMDEIVVDGLEVGFAGVESDGTVNVELDNVSDRVLKEMSLLFHGKIDMNNLVEKYISVMLFVEEDGYTIYDKGSWEEKVYFELVATHSEKVEIVSKVIEDSTENIPLISYNDGESYKNTIDDNTLIIVYCGYNFKTSEIIFKNSYISAATIKKAK